MVPLLGAIAGCHCGVLWLRGRGAIAGCHCSVLWLSGRGANAGCRCRVPLWCAMVEWTWCGAIVVSHGWGEGDDQLWLSGRGAIAGCHCRVPL